MDLIATIVISVLGGGTLTALVMAFIGRRKERADTRKVTAETDEIESKTRQSETVYYQSRVEETIAQMVLLEAKVRELTAAIEVAREMYERRVGGLHEKVDGLVTALDRANAALDKANDTITQLRQEVKDGNAIITELRKEITQLLVKQAEKK